jgi:plastocyanin
MKNPSCSIATKNLLLKFLYFFTIILFFNKSAIAQENSNNEFLIKIKDHRFEPSIINVPVNTSFKLIIENLDKTLEEFESDDLKKEKLVASGKKITIPVNGLNTGEYKFYGDFHQKTAQGKIIVK